MMLRVSTASKDISAPAHRRVPMRTPQLPGHLGQLTVLSLALAASFVPLTAQATCASGGTISSNLAGTQYWSAGDCSIDSGISITGGTPALNANASVGTLTNSGVIRGGETGFRNSSTQTVGAIINSGTISANSSYGMRNQGTIGSLANTGLISAAYAGIYNTSLITSLNNAGTIRGSVIGILNNATISSLTNDSIVLGSIGISNTSATIATLTNNGTIQGTASGIYNGSLGTISSLTNDGSILSYIGINNIGGTIATLTNNGTIQGTINGIFNGNLGTISSLINSGTIYGTTYGIQSDNNSSISSLNNTSSGTIGGNSGVLVGQLSPSGSINVSTLTNAGRIYGTTNVGVGTSANGTIGLLINSGTITGGAGAVGNAGRINTLINSGTISSNGFAIYNASTGTLGPISNSGLIAGTIANMATTGLTINGGSGSTFGVLTGASGSIGSASMGSIAHSSADLSFNSGNLLLNDHVNVGSYMANNNGATLQVNNQVSITGNYHQAAAATLAIGVSSGAVTNGVSADTGYGRLLVSGAAVIDSGSAVALKPVTTYGFAAGQRYVVVQAATSGTNYNASNLVYSAAGYSGGITGSTVIDGSNSHLVLTLGSTGSTPSVQASTSNAVSAMNGLFNYGGTDAGLLNVFNASAALGSTDAANRAGAQLSPTSNAVAATQASSVPIQTVLNVAGARVDGLRIARTEDGMTGISAGDSNQAGAMWGQAFGGVSSQDQRDNVSGYRATYNGLLIGADAPVNDAWRLGGLFSYASTSLDSRDANSGSGAGLKSYGLVAYGGYTTDKWYLNLSGGVFQHKYKTSRLIDFAGFSGTALGRYDGTQSVVSALAGYPIRLDAQTVLTPIAGLTYSELRQDGYTETGGNGAALTVASNKSSSLKSDIGTKLERSFDTSYGRLVPSLQVSWRHEFKDTRLRSVANYAVDTTGTTGFTTYGAKPIADTGVMVLGVTLVRSEKLTVAARYTLEAGSGYTGQTADVRLRYQF